MKKIVYAVYHDCNSEARSMELLHCCRKLGKVDYVSYAAPLGIDDIHVHLVRKESLLALIDFIYLSKKVIKQVCPDWVLLHDNDCSVLIPFIKKNFPKTKIIYDSSELYIPMPGEHKESMFSHGTLMFLKVKLTTFRRTYEKKYLKDADVVIAANLERATIMQEYFGLKTRPIIFDNMHKIEESFDWDVCEKKYGYAFGEKTFNIIFAGGISEQRHTFEFIDAFRKMGEGYKLIIVGSASDKMLEKYKNAVQNISPDCIHFFGFISRGELRYCLQKSQASVILFNKNSYNTIYCASGKCFESLFEGVPIIVSENPPLKRLCTEQKVGVSDDCFENGIKLLVQNYDEYCNCVKKYIDQLDYNSRVDCLAEKIIKTIN